MHYKFKNNVLIFIILFPLVCFSQTGSKVDSTNKNSHSIQFYLINQVIAGYKYDFSEHSSLRFLINASGLFNNKDADNIKYTDYSYDTVTYSTNRHIITNNQFYEVKCQYLFQNNLSEIVKLFFGGGPMFNYRFVRNEETAEQKNSNDNKILTNYYKRDENTWNLGISAVAGIECSVYGNITLFSELEMLFYYGKQNNESYNQTSSYSSVNDKYEIRGYELRSLRVGIGVYF